VPDHFDSGGAGIKPNTDPDRQPARGAGKQLVADGALAGAANYDKSDRDERTLVERPLLEKFCFRFGSLPAVQDNNLAPAPGFALAGQPNGTGNRDKLVRHGAPS